MTLRRLHLAVAALLVSGAALGDISRATCLVRHGHERFHVDPRRVGVMGSSAGGHLALTACIHATAGDAPDEAVARQLSGELAAHENVPPLARQPRILTPCHRSA